MDGLKSFLFPFRFIRRLVSRKRRRYVDENYDLDLSYIGNRIIAMGWPSNSYERMYRNDAKHVRKFLDDKHHDHYMIINLCSERNYSASLFPGARLINYPFQDHQVPQIEQIYSFCNACFEWLEADEKNVLVVHCKAGKGRTGLMMTCFLVYVHWKAGAEGTELIRRTIGVGRNEVEPDLSTVIDCLQFYASKRTTNHKGVTIPSQIRYVHYFHKFLHMRPEPLYQKKYRYLVRLYLSSLFRDVSEFYFTINQGTTSQRLIFQSEKFIINNVTKRQFNYVFSSKITDLMPIPIVGDIQIRFYEKRSRLILQFWLNTFFMQEKTKLLKHEVDTIHKENKHMVDDDFYILFIATDKLERLKKDMILV